MHHLPEAERKDLGHEQPTVLLTNDFRATPAARILRYARRMLIENGLTDAVNFLHLDALSSAVALNVRFDVLLTTMATGIYRLFAPQLRGFERTQVPWWEGRTLRFEIPYASPVER